MGKYIRGKDELAGLLEEQISALRASSKAYDQGELWEAKRLASAAFILLHDGSGKSLLSQLGYRRNMEFLNTNRGADNGISVPLCTVLITAGTGAEYVPRLGEMPGTLGPFWSKFGRWYEESIFVNERGATLSRKNLVCAMRSQDGGAHVDREIKNDEYQWLKTRNDTRLTVNADLMGIQIAPNGGKGGIPVKNAHLASMRQVAWEIDQSLMRIQL